MDIYQKTVSTNKKITIAVENNSKYLANMQAILNVEYLLLRACEF
jgi:hypothetical protein